MASIFAFTRLPTSSSLARLGRVSLLNRRPIDTPAFLPVTSRGAVPHLTPDNLSASTAGVVLALEDFIEKASTSTSPLYALPHLLPPSPQASALRTFTALPLQLPLILSPRRIPPVPCPGNHTDTSIVICTSVGYRPLEVGDYSLAARGLGADIICAIQDVVAREKISRRRIEKMLLRTEKWVDALTRLEGSGVVFAPLLPVEVETQRGYVDNLEANEAVQGLIVSTPWTAGELAVLPDRLKSLPVLSTAEAITPQELLEMVAVGADLFAVPFLQQSIDAGVLLLFEFPGPADSKLGSRGLPLGIDMHVTPSMHSSDPLAVTTTHGCGCVVCQRHNHTYINHLLLAREMLAWTLIAQHNMHFLTLFFEAVRAAIAGGNFDQAKELFERTYADAWPEPVPVPAPALPTEEPDSSSAATMLPQGMRNSKPQSHGPRSRGYQSTTTLGQRSELLRAREDGNEEGWRYERREKLNGKAWENLIRPEGDMVTD